MVNVDVLGGGGVVFSTVHKASLCTAVLDNNPLANNDPIKKH